MKLLPDAVYGGTGRRAAPGGRQAEVRRAAQTRERDIKE